MPQTVQIQTPSSMKGGTYYDKGNPQCPIAFAMDACKIPTSKRFRKGDMYLSHMYDAKLAEFISQYGYDYWDALEAINRAVFDADDSKDEPTKLTEIFTTFIGKFPKAFQLKTGKTPTPKVPFKATITSKKDKTKKKNKRKNR